jgi:DNA-binding winged helix-turn-helix (wHTH) protein
MDQILRRDLKFGHFVVDQLRGCVRVGERNIDLRPKAFEVLRHLAENAGRLVSKAELHDAVWGRVAVSDDSLVQCIRELRQKLGDADRGLIKTVPRRGYLLDVEKPAAQVTPEDRDASASIPAGALVHGSIGEPFFRQRFRRAAAFGAALGAGLGAALIAAVGLAFLPRASLLVPAPRDLVSDLDARRMAELAAEKQLPIPPFNIAPPAAGVPEALRRFVGVRVGEDGWLSSHRQFMVIVTDANQGGDVSGYFTLNPVWTLPKDGEPQSTQRARADIVTAAALRRS